jgi:hypothetical protein
MRRAWPTDQRFSNKTLTTGAYSSYFSRRFEAVSSITCFMVYSVSERTVFEKGSAGLNFYYPNFDGIPE